MCDAGEEVGWSVYDGTLYSFRPYICMEKCVYSENAELKF